MPCLNRCPLREAIILEPLNVKRMWPRKSMASFGDSDLPGLRVTDESFGDRPPRFSLASIWAT